MDFERYRYLSFSQGYFDPAYYLDRLLDSGLEVPADGTSLFEHYAREGFRQGIEPGPAFSLADCVERHPELIRAGVDPLHHFLAMRDREGGRSSPGEVLPGVVRDDAIKPIAFFLPQFHPIPENDQAWGEGFTEWTNVRKATPLYPGHAQPRLPSDLGFYDLRNPEVLREQVRLARRYGLYGFCFYYYWFNGRRVLEKPIDLYLKDEQADLPFCVCWANENWTRRWDGLDSEVVIAQDHNPLSDYRFIYDLLPVLADPRYIRVQGRPLLLIYRTDLLATPAETLDAWREVARRAGLGGLYIAGVRFHTQQAKPWGLDALVEFPPHHFPAPELSPDECVALGVDERFAGTIRDYEAGLDALILDGAPRADAPIFPGVMPSWDNTARRGPAATVYKGSSPDLFCYWLVWAFERARRLPDSLPRLTFINAWNEWAEGAMLEPGEADSRARLEALGASLSHVEGDSPGMIQLQRLLAAVNASSRPACVLVSHDAEFGGSQILLLRLLESLRSEGGLACGVLLCGPGPLRKRFEALAPTVALQDFADLGWGPDVSLPFIARRLKALGDVSVLANTVATGDTVVRHFARAGLHVLSYVHELPTSIEMYGAAEGMRAIGRLASHVVVVSEFVRKALSGIYQIPAGDLEVIHTGLASRAVVPLSRDQIARRYHLPETKYLVVGSGAVHARKGVDLFVQVAKRLCDLGERDDYLFLWLGGDQSDAGPRLWAIHDARGLGIDDRVHFLGLLDDALPVMAQADLLLLPSREDPFPLVVLEAIELGLPVVCFEGAGGASEIAARGAGLAVPYLDTDAMAERAGQLLRDPGARERLAEAGRALRNEFRWEDYVERMAARLKSLAVDGASRRKGSRLKSRAAVAEDLCVVIPSYNHARYIEEAIDSVLSQSLRPAEIRIIDDGSSDGSVELLQRLSLHRYGVQVTCRENRGAHETLNEGIAATDRPLVAILNSDDRYHPLRFERLLPALRDPSGLDFVFSRVRMFDNQGHIGGHNEWYEGGIERFRANRSLWLTLLWRNFLLTTSNLMGRRAAFEALGGFRAYRYSHDVDFMVRAILSGRRAEFVEASLCDYRFHDANTIRENAERLMIEDAFIVADILRMGSARFDSGECSAIDDIIAEKKIGNLVRVFRQGLTQHPHDYDYRRSYADSRFGAWLAEAGGIGNAPSLARGG